MAYGATEMETGCKVTNASRGSISDSYATKAGLLCLNCVSKI